MPVVVSDFFLYILKIQFFSLQGGKDHASGRYIYTKLSPITRHIFHESDGPLLKYEDDEDGQFIEPKWYNPIFCCINMILCLFLLIFLKQIVATGSCL